MQYTTRHHIKDHILRDRHKLPFVKKRHLKTVGVNNTKSIGNDKITIAPANVMVGYNCATCNLLVQRNKFYSFPITYVLSSYLVLPSPSRHLPCHCSFSLGLFRVVLSKAIDFANSLLV